MVKVAIIVEPGRESYDAWLPAAPHKGDYVRFTRTRNFDPLAGDTERKVKKVVLCTWTEQVEVYV